MASLKVNEVIFRDDLYPRIQHDPKLVQKYAASIELLPPIEVNQHNELIDGWHRWTAHKSAEVDDIDVIVTETRNEAHFLQLACIANAKHGKQLTEDDKREMAMQLFHGGKGISEPEICNCLSVPDRTLRRWLENIKAANKQKRERIIRDMWLACKSQQEIADALQEDRTNIARELETLCDLANWPECTKLAQFDDVWDRKLYDIWSFAKNDNEVEHFGNTHVGIVDNLLFKYTDPFDIVIDPFAGGGSTIDICKHRLRRYFVSDHNPIVERESEIPQHTASPNDVRKPPQWKDVKLVYLDPPYWKQAEKKYSVDDVDLANQTLDDFTDNLAGIISTYAGKLHSGSHIALIISPTQWPNEDKSTVYHDIDMIRHSKLKSKVKLVQHIICPYSTEQYNGTQVDIAKEQKLWMCISRRLTVWEVL